MRGSLLLLFAVVLAGTARAQVGSNGAKLPVREVTLFKDGHAFIRHEGKVATDSAGAAVLDLLPAPVLGTFWPFAAQSGVTLASVRVGLKGMPAQRDAIGMGELIAANVGAEVTLRMDSLWQLQGTLLGMSTDSTRSSPAGLGGLVMIRTADKVRAMPIERIAELSFKSPPRRTLARVDSVPRLIMEFDGSRPKSEVQVGLTYLQYGLKWTPSYQVEIDGKGNAIVSMRATIENDVVDLNGVTANLVIGVPSFAFKDRVDPMAIQQALVEVDALLPQNGRFGYVRSAAVNGQLADYRNGDREAGHPADSVQFVGRTEDLFVFTVPNLTLKRGERLSLPVARYTVKYTDVYALTMYHAAPIDIRANQSPEQAELSRVLSRPSVMHRVRLQNNSGQPFTTAPAVVLRGGSLLAQGMMTYGPSGTTVDIDLTKALDIQVEKEEQELRRVPAALRWRGSDYSRVDLSGSLTLTNRRDEPVEIEITRYLLGHVDSTTTGPRRSRVNLLGDEDYLPPQYTRWWGMYSWPWWWPALNGVERLQWTVKLPPGAKQESRFRWHYFWEP